MTNDLFASLADSYQHGELDNSLDSVFSIAAASGVVLLPGNARAYVDAKGGTYEVNDLLLPFNRDVWKTITAAHSAGINVFPEWFTFNEDKKYFDFNQGDFCREFIKYYNLTKHGGEFYTNGVKVTNDGVKDFLRRSLAIVRKDAGSLINGTFEALKAMCRDDDPGKKKVRISLEAVDVEMQARGYGVRYNVITDEYEVTGKTPSGRVMSHDDLVTQLHSAISDVYKGVSFEILRQYTSFRAREREYNPVLDLIKSAEWDGVDRLPQVYALIGVEDDGLSKTLIRKWLFQTVALLFNDPERPFGADGCLVLNGKELGSANQGAGKTSFFRHLAMRDAWFGEGCSIDDRDKDTIRRVLTKWIAELGEVESTLKSDISKLKALISKESDAYRLTYGRSDTVGVRTTSLCATCNSDRYLIDPTGNRRWWTVPVRRVMPRAELLDIDALQLWAQIYSVVAPMEYDDKAACFRLTAEELTALAVRNGEFEKPLKGQTEVEDIISISKRDGYKWREMTVSEFKEYWYDSLKQYSSQQIGAALKACGYETKRSTGGIRVAVLPTSSKL